MQAIVQERYIERPDIGDGEVLVRVRAASIHVGADLQVLKTLVEAGKVLPVIDAAYPLRETPRAIGHVATGHARGTVALAIDPTTP